MRRSLLVAVLGLSLSPVAQALTPISTQIAECAARGEDGRMMGNSDGFEVDSTHNVLIENCTFCQGDIALEKIVADELTDRDYVANVRNFAIDGVAVAPTATAAMASEIAGLDPSAAVYNPEAREYMLALTDGTVRGTVIRRSRDRKFWSEPRPAFNREVRVSDKIASVKVRRGSDGWYLDVVFSSGERKTYYTPEAFWPFVRQRG